MMQELVYDKAAVGSRIRENRLALQFTQEQLAEKLNKSLRLITDLERGAVGMSIETLIDLCRVLKVTPNDLLLPDQQAPTSEVDWLVQALTNATPHVRASAIEIVKSYLRSV